MEKVLTALCLLIIALSCPFISSTANSAEKDNSDSILIDYSQPNPYGNRIVFEVFKVKQDSNEEFYYYISDKGPFGEETVSKIIKSIKSSPERERIVVYDPNDSPEKLTYLKDEFKKNKIEIQYVPIQNLLEKRTKVTSELKNEYNAVRAKFSRLRLNIRNEKDINKENLEKAIKLYSDFLEKHKNQQNHYLYKRIKVGFSTLKKIEKNINTK